MQRLRPTLAILVTFAVSAWVSVACNNKSLEERARAAASATPGGLTPELSSKVLARVGDRTITLGDYAVALERMNEFDRLRYQSPERRKDLLNDMIDFELLAIEAEKRGLDKKPETEEAIRQVLRDAMLAEARKGLPVPADIPTAEVRAYYEAHRDEYREPERRRVSAIVLRDAKEAEKLLPDARKASAAEWGKLAAKHGDGPAPKASPSHPVETLGDLGIVGPPGDPRGDHPRVPEPVRAAVFTIQGDVGTVLDKVVEAGGRFYIVKLAGRSGAHERSFAEAERSIRGLLLQQKSEQRERDLHEELKRQFPVSIDEAALAQVKVPQAAVSAPKPDGPAPAPPPSAGR